MTKDEIPTLDIIDDELLSLEDINILAVNFAIIFHPQPSPQYSALDLTAISLDSIFPEENHTLLDQRFAQLMADCELNTAALLHEHRKYDRTYPSVMQQLDNESRDLSDENLSIELDSIHKAELFIDSHSNTSLSPPSSPVLVQTASPCFGFSPCENELTHKEVEFSFVIQKRKSILTKAGKLIKKFFGKAKEWFLGSHMLTYK